jgi:hypothetical protein
MQARFVPFSGTEQPSDWRLQLMQTGMNLLELRAVPISALLEDQAVAVLGETGGS